MRLQKIIALTIFSALLHAAPVSAAQVALSQNPKTLVDDPGERSFTFLPEVKITSVDGRSGSLVGARLGMIVDHKFMVGVGGFGMTSPAAFPMGYGGAVIEYMPWSDRVAHVSFGGLVGAGGLYSQTFFVAEPEVRLNINVTRWFRVALGGGYRFIGGADSLNSVLSGPELICSLGFGR